METSESAALPPMMTDRSNNGLRSVNRGGPFFLAWKLEVDKFDWPNGERALLSPLRPQVSSIAICYRDRPNGQFVEGEGGKRRISQTASASGLWEGGTDDFDYTVTSISQAVSRPIHLFTGSAQVLMEYLFPQARVTDSNLTRYNPFSPTRSKELRKLVAQSFVND